MKLQYLFESCIIIIIIIIIIIYFHLGWSFLILIKAMAISLCPYISIFLVSVPIYSLFSFYYLPSLGLSV